jgi:NAD(P)-dependent dehydrogenase (short-subunit alcohol dehydrogenase family)
MFVTKYVSKQMIDNGIKGSIINICSDAALQGEQGNSGYSAAKAGLLNFSRAAAMDLALYGIRVNTISPTYIEHNMWRFGGVGNPEGRTRYSLTANDFLQGIPLGRFCRATDVANTAVYLASDLSSFLTAVDIPLDGGAGRKYWPWIPGNVTGINATEYYDNTQHTKFGEPIET